jgi:hypothetical protein
MEDTLKFSGAMEQSSQPRKDVAIESNDEAPHQQPTPGLERERAFRPEPNERQQYAGEIFASANDEGPSGCPAGEAEAPGHRVVVLTGRRPADGPASRGGRISLQKEFHVAGHRAVPGGRFARRRQIQLSIHPRVAQSSLLSANHQLDGLNINGKLL